MQQLEKMVRDFITLLTVRHSSNHFGWITLRILETGSEAWSRIPGWLGQLIWKSPGCFTPEVFQVHTLEGDPRADQEHARVIAYLLMPGNVLGYPRKSWGI